MPEDGSISIPFLLPEDSNAKEILRVWENDADMHVSLLVNPEEDPESWGPRLVGLVYEIADSYHQQTGYSFDEILARIKAGFDVEWNSPTDEAKGRIIKG